MMLDCGCPGEYPDWHNQDVNLGGFSTHTLGIPMLFNMPLAYAAYLKRQQLSIQRLELPERWPGLVLTKAGFFRGKIIRLLETNSSLSSDVSSLEHPFHIRAWLHEGNLSTARDAIRQMQMSLFDSGRLPGTLYLSYLTCPYCSEQRGGDKLFLLRRWKKSKKLEQRLAKKQSG